MSKFFASLHAGTCSAWLMMGLLATVCFQFSALAAAPPSLVGSNPSNRSFSDLRDAAEKGDPLAQRLVANAYLTGEGVRQDTVEAVKWLRLAADKRDPLAQYVLGILYDEGKGVPRDLREAVKWYELAAAQGLPDAQYNLGICYSKGEGLPKDTKKAVEWFRKAAEQGDAQSQSRLGLAYVTGNGVERNPTEAVSWLRRAAYQDDAKAQFFLGRLYQEGEGVAQEPDTAVKWFRKAASQGYADAQFHLGRALIAGEGVARNPSEGRDWMEKAAAQKHEGATQYLAQLSRERFNVPSASVPPSGMSPLTAAASGQTATKTSSGAFSPTTSSGKESPFAAPRDTGFTPVSPATGGLTFTPSAQDSATNLNPALAMRDPLPAVPALPPPGKSAAPEVQPSLPPFTAAPSGKEPSAAASGRDLFTLPPAGGKEPEPGSLFTEPARTREPQPEARARENSFPTPTPSGSSESSNWVAITSMLISALILFLGIAMLVVFKTRLHGLETELKKAQFELSKANVNLSAMMHQVEQLSLMAPAVAAPKASLSEWNPEPAKAHTSSFKMHRSK